VANLTAKAIEKLKASTSARYISDGKVPGLQLRVAPDGSRSWSVRYRIGKQQRRLTLGDAAVVPLADDADKGNLSARTRARRALQQAKDGIDPAAAKQERREADTFAQLADEYIEKYAKKRKKSWREDQRILNADILPHWKHRLVRDLTRRDVRTRVDAIAERAPIVANRVVALLSKVFMFALDREIIDTSPAVKITKPGRETKRDRVLTHDEIRTFWTQTGELEAPMRAFYRLRLLTAQRGIEVSTMRWEDVDLAGGWWTIPSTVAKNKLSHRVPLSATVVDLLKGIPRNKHTKYVLDGARGKRQQAEAAATLTIADFRGHDLRRTAASLMAGSGTPRLVISKILNHVETGVTAVYDRHGYDNEKRIALDAWARTLTAILEQKAADVLPFAARS
jgi:integrase